MENPPLMATVQVVYTGEGGDVDVPALGYTISPGDTLDVEDSVAQRLILRSDFRPFGEVVLIEPTVIDEPPSPVVRGPLLTASEDISACLPDGQWYVFHAGVPLDVYPQHVAALLAVPCIDNEDDPKRLDQETGFDLTFIHGANLDDVEPEVEEPEPVESESDDDPSTED